jgi:hypothetical protein
MEKSKNKKQKGLPQGRPNKFEAFTKVLAELFRTDEWNSWPIVCSDEELVFMVNQKLGKEETITERAFRMYKSGELPRTDGEYDYVSVFFSSYKKALIGQKHIIMENLAADSPGAWQKWAWLLERKFDEFNLRSKSVDETPDVKRLVLKVGE